MKGADKCFEEVCAGIGSKSVAEIYRDHPDLKVTHWREIRAKVAELIGTGDDPDLGRRLRHEWAERLDVLVGTHFYTNLDTEARQTLAKYMYDSDLETQDRVYYISMAYDFTFASVLDGIILNSWRGPPGSLEQLKKHKENFISSCQDYCQLALEIAKRKRDGREATEEEQEAGKLVYYMKEFTRRALAGEKIFDE